MKKDQNQYWTRKTRRLYQALMISGALNIGLLASFFYFTLQEKTEFEEKSLVREEIDEKTPFSETNAEVISQLFDYSFEELVNQLDNKVSLEGGYTYRDFALACLVSYHHFHLEKVLSGFTIQKRQMTFYHPSGGEKIGITVFPSLGDARFKAIMHFAKTEKWPLTPQGLFKEMKLREKSLPVSLKEAFYLTAEFHSLVALFLRSEFTIDRDILLRMVLEGDFKTLDDFFKKQKKSLDFSKRRRRELLTSYFEIGSSVAADLFIEMDREYVFRWLDDRQILKLLDLLDGPTEEVSLFVKELMTCLRSDEVRQKAGKKLYEFSGEKAPNPYDHFLALARFMPQENFNKIKETNKQRLHIVKKGDTLWQIARDYKVDLKCLKEANKMDLESFLQPGRRLIIPD